MSIYHQRPLKPSLTQKLTSGTPTATLQSLAYQYDLKGNMATLTDTVNNITHTYTYDGLNRLVTATGQGTNSYTQTYTYDAIGNITYKSDVGNYTYYYTDKPHAVRSTTGLANITFQYDANGKMLSKTVTQGPGTTLSSIVWNEDNKPVTITTGTGTVTFSYDGNGNRVIKTKGSNTTYYYGDAYEKRNTVGIIHLFANHQRLASIRTDGKNQYYHGNHLGSASVITDQNGNLKQKIEYFPYGTYRYGTSPDQQMGTYDYDGTFPNANYTFTDQEDDDETGLYNYGARLYDPQLGRFISADSIVPRPDDLQSFNRYSYCLNNPLVYTDPSGHEVEGGGGPDAGTDGGGFAGPCDWGGPDVGWTASNGGVDPGVEVGVGEETGKVVVGYDGKALVGPNNPNISLLSSNIGNHGYRASGQPSVFGREGAFIEPGDPVSQYVVDNVKNMDLTARYHDAIVDILRNEYGVPDVLACYPTMVPAYIAATVVNNLSDRDGDSKANNFTIFEWRW